jgi:hypothetical protein
MAALPWPSLTQFHYIPLFFISETMYEILSRIIAKRVTLLWRYENIRSLNGHRYIAQSV